MKILSLCISIVLLLFAGSYFTATLSRQTEPPKTAMESNMAMKVARLEELIKTTKDPALLRDRQLYLRFIKRLADPSDKETERGIFTPLSSERIQRIFQAP